jgi:hypothetical protein
MKTSKEINMWIMEILSRNKWQRKLSEGEERKEEEEIEDNDTPRYIKFAACVDCYVI